MAADGTLLYFAYGSNLCRTQMASRCPSGAAVGRALLPDHALIFPRRSAIRQCGVASIVPQSGRVVWGAVYRPTPDDFVALDGYEGFDPARAAHENSYNKVMLSVLVDGDPRQALAAISYVAVAMQGPHKPSADYRDTMLRGAREHGLPHDYLAALELIATEPRGSEIAGC